MWVLPLYFGLRTKRFGWLVSAVFPDFMSFLLNLIHKAEGAASLWSCHESVCNNALPRSDIWLSTWLQCHTHTPPDPHPHPTHILPEEKQSQSIRGMDQCLWLGCCIRLFDETSMMCDNQSRGWRGRCKLLPNKEPALEEGRGFGWPNSAKVKPEETHFNKCNRCSRLTGYGTVQRIQIYTAIQVTDWNNLHSLKVNTTALTVCRKQEQRPLSELAQRTRSGQSAVAEL